MKRIITLVTAAVLAALLLAGCSASTSSLGITSGADGVITIEAKNASADNNGKVDFTVKENQKIVFDASSLTKGKLEIAFKSKDGSGKEAGSASVSAKATNTFDIDPGEYEVVVSVLENADGTAKITAQ